VQLRIPHFARVLQHTGAIPPVNRLNKRFTGRYGAVRCSATLPQLVAQLLLFQRLPWRTRKVWRMGIIEHPFLLGTSDYASTSASLPKATLHRFYLDNRFV